MRCFFPTTAGGHLNVPLSVYSTVHLVRLCTTPRLGRLCMSLQSLLVLDITLQSCVRHVRLAKPSSSETSISKKATCCFVLRPTCPSIKHTSAV